MNVYLSVFTALFSMLNSSSWTQLDNVFGIEPEARRLYLNEKDNDTMQINRQNFGKFLYATLQINAKLRYPHQIAINITLT